MAMHILIIEDEPAASDHLKRLIQQSIPEALILDVLDTVESAISWLESHDEPHVIFTDVQLGDGVCFDIFKKHQPKCPIIFTTAYNEYAIHAFKVNAIDYLLKPIKKQEFSETFDRLRRLIDEKMSIINFEQLSSAYEDTKEKYNHRYVIRFGEQMRTITSSDIAYVYTLQKGVFATTNEGRSYALDKSLEQMEQELDPHYFFRINRQFIIHIDSIGKMQIVSKSRVKIDLTPPFQEGDVIVSTEKSPIFKAWLKR